MADPVIVPPTPTVRQGEPIDTSPGLEQVQKIFDQVAPAIKTEPTKKSAEKPVEKPAQAPAEPVTPPEKTVTPPAEPSKTPADESHKLPSFLEEAIKVEPSKQAEPTSEDEWPEELPAFKTDEERKSRYKRWRDAHKALREEVKTLRSRPAQDEVSAQRLATLEAQNKQMGETLSRMGVEQHQEFQNNVIRPMSAAWNEASRIVKDAGGEPADLAKAMSLSGKAQFEALDALFEQMPESAKIEVQQQLSQWRRLNEARVQWLKDAPRTFEALRKKDLENQFQMVNKQRAEMEQLFENAVKTLREEAKVEVLRKTNDPETKWWDDQADAIVSQAKALYLDNTDMGKMAMAVVLAPMADAYRKLWLGEQAAHKKTKDLVKERLGGEPSITESPGGANNTPEAQMKDDLKKPFSEVFLREFHRSQARNVR